LFELEHTGTIQKSTYFISIHGQANQRGVGHPTSLCRAARARPLAIRIVWVLDTPTTGTRAVDAGAVFRDCGIADFTCVLAKYDTGVARRNNVQQKEPPTPA
jgi:hypothetical protein